MKRTAVGIFVLLSLAYFLPTRAAGGAGKKTFVTITVAHATSSEIVIEINPVCLKSRPAIPDQRKIFLNKENSGQVTLLLDGPARIKIMNVWRDSSIYYMLMPGTDFNIRLDVYRRDYREVGDVGEKENQFHDFIIGETERRLNSLPQLDPVSYIMQWKWQADTMYQFIRSAAQSGLDTSYTSWDQENVRSIFQAGLRQQLVSYVTVRGLWPANMVEYITNATSYTEAQLNNPGFFTAEGDQKLVPAYYLFQSVLHYYEKDSKQTPSLEAVYSEALNRAAKIISPDIKNLMQEYLVVNAVSRTNDTAFLKLLQSGFSRMPKGKYFQQLADTKLALLRTAAVGQPAPFFAAKSPGGKPFSFSDYAGSYIYIDVWATWCLPCIAEFPNMEKLKEKYADKPVVFISVSYESKRELWSQFLTDRNMSSGHFYSDPSSGASIQNIYLTKYIPAFILIGPDGKVISPACYRPSDPAMEMLLDRLLR